MDEYTEDMRKLQQEHHSFLKVLFLYIIRNIFYSHILDRMDMLNSSDSTRVNIWIASATTELGILKPPDMLKHLRVKIRIYGEDFTSKNKSQIDKDSKINLKPMDNNEFGYFRSKYFIIVDLTVVSEDNVSHVVLYIMVKIY